MINVNSDISINRQTELLDVSKSSIYYNSTPSKKTVKTMNAIDEIYTEFPYFGHRRIRKMLDTEHGVIIGKKKTRSLMKRMGLEAIYPRKHPNTSKSNSFHKKFPYLLKNLIANKPNHIWGTDITYIRMEHGFIYLSAIIDWYSRYVIAWNLSETLESAFCIKTLNEALEINTPEIHNSDQGVQYTSKKYIAILEKTGSVKISMDGRGRCFDNIFTERLWRSVKQENIYLNNYNNTEEVQIGLTKYFTDYNERRPHQSLNYQTPAKIYLPESNIGIFNKSKINTFTPIVVV